MCQNQKNMSVCQLTWKKWETYFKEKTFLINAANSLYIYNTNMKKVHNLYFIKDVRIT